MFHAKLRWWKSTCTCKRYMYTCTWTVYFWFQLAFHKKIFRQPKTFVQEWISTKTSWCFVSTSIIVHVHFSFNAMHVHVRVHCACINVVCCTCTRMCSVHTTLTTFPVFPALSRVKFFDCGLHGSLILQEVGQSSVDPRNCRTHLSDVSDDGCEVSAKLRLTRSCNKTSKSEKKHSDSIWYCNVASLVNVPCKS